MRASSVTARSGAPTRRVVALFVALAMAFATLVVATFNANPAAAATNAIRDLDICTAESIPANDDGFSDEYTLPFPINFFGERHETVYVNNNGNVTFDRGLYQYTPEDLTGPTGNALIAPFFADIDTRGDGSSQVTYGSDATTFCVNWVDVGYYNQEDDKLVKAQLLISDRSAATGNEGDVSLEFNYSDIEWETGSASGGSDGFGGNSAGVGYTAGTGETGTFTQLPGSLVNGALIDGGPNALVDNSRNSNVLGRYVFNIGGEDIVQEGNLTGSVSDEDGNLLAGVDIEACLDDNCATTQTRADGTYDIAGLPVGEYQVTAAAPTPADGVVRLDAVTLPVTVTAGQTAELDFVLPAVIYGNLTVTVEESDGTPVGAAAVTVCDSDDAENCFGPVETEADGTATWAEDTLRVGDYDVSVDAPADSELQGSDGVVTLVEGEDAAVTITLLPVPNYIINGEVQDQDGELIDGATVILTTQDDGDFTMVPEGSAWLGEATPNNPQSTDETGVFGWTVVDPEANGVVYAVNAEAETCEAAGVTVDEFNAEGEPTVVLTLECAEGVVEPEPTTPSEPTTPENPATPESTTPDNTPPAGDAADVNELAETGFSAPMGLVALTLIGAGGFVLLRRRAMQTRA